jgi:hypothetical protein
VENLPETNTFSDRFFRSQRCLLFLCREGGAAAAAVVGLLQVFKAAIFALHDTLPFSSNAKTIIAPAQKSTTIKERGCVI